MGINNKPGGNSPIFKIEARPQEHDAVIDRQGQWARIIHSLPCSCLNNGKINLFCNKCNGRGFVYYFQSEKEVWEEDSPHTGQNILYPFWTPITKVIKVQRKLAEVQGGNKNYKIDSFTDEEIFISGQPTPKHYEIIQCTYRFSNFETEYQTFTYNGDNYFKLDLRIDKIFQERKNQDDWQSLSNAYSVECDINKIIEVKNLTKDITYDLSLTRIKKQYIYLDVDEITIDINDKIKITVEYVFPEKVATTQLSSKKMLEKWGSDVESGDVDATFQSWTDIKNGDIITFLISAQSKYSKMKRTRKNYDEIPEFDVIEILEDIKDEDGIIYKRGIDFEIRNYNDLYWIGNKPDQEKIYSIVYSYKMTYIVQAENKRHINNENKRFPRNVLLREYSRVKNKEPKID